MKGQVEFWEIGGSVTGMTLIILFQLKDDRVLYVILYLF